MVFWCDEILIGSELVSMDKTQEHSLYYYKIQLQCCRSWRKQFVFRRTFGLPTRIPKWTTFGEGSCAITSTTGIFVWNSKNNRAWERTFHSVDYPFSSWLSCWSVLRLSLISTQIKLIYKWDINTLFEAKLVTNFNRRDTHKFTDWNFAEHIFPPAWDLSNIEHCLK